MNLKRLPISPALTRSFYAASLGALLWAPVARAETIISNFAGANDSFGTILASINPGIGLSKAAGFTMPAGPSYSLNSVTLRLGRNDVEAAMELALFGDAGGNPVGPPLVSFIAPDFGLGVSDVVFAPDSPFTLLPSTTYWLAARGGASTENFGLLWLASSLPGGNTPTGIATAAGYRVDDSDIWPPQEIAVVDYTYSVQATVVPEPSTLLILFGLGTVGVLTRNFACRVRTDSRSADCLRAVMVVCGPPPSAI